DHDLRAKTVRKFRCTTDSDHDRPVAENLLDRQFDPACPNEAWVADITYILTRQGWLYLAAVEDLYSRRVVFSVRNLFPRDGDSWRLKSTKCPTSPLILRGRRSPRARGACVRAKQPRAADGRIMFLGENPNTKPVSRFTYATQQELG